MANPFDDTAKTRYRNYFERRGIRAIPQYEVFSLSRATDLMVECSKEDMVGLQNTIFAHFRRINALEFKGIHDPLTAPDLNLILMRAWGFGVVDKGQQDAAAKSSSQATFLSTEEIARMPRQRTATVVCVTRPRNILDTWQDEFCFVQTDESGIYCDNAQKVPTWIIHPTELALKPTNYALLPLARGRKLEQFIELCLAQGLVEYLQLTLDIGLVSDPDVIWRKIMEVFGMELTIHEETWPYIDEFFRNVPEAMQKVPSFQEALEESERQGQRRMLLRFLHHKFGDLPNKVIQLIEKTSDAEQLDHWMDQVFDAESLAAMKFSFDDEI
ncbi:MAG: hypothetical protein R3C14_41140 [Caldilineaceae bacterium]